jgi:phenylacetate-coenzyme A ligase PaaK-like adenylate-forming protein
VAVAAAGRHPAPAPCDGPAAVGRAGPPAIDPWLWSETFGETWLAGLDPAGAGARQRAQRLASLLSAAQASPLYHQRLHAAHASAPQDLQAIEPVGKAELMQRFDDWSTDRRVTRAAVERFLCGPSQPADAFLGQYMVWTSSGTSGTPGIFVQDARSLAAYEALDAWRLRGSPTHGVPLAAWGVWQRFAFVGATGGHFAGVVSVERLRRLAAGPAAPFGWLAPSVQTFSVLTPLETLATRLQAYQPAVLITYPSCAAALAQLQLARRLELRLTELWCGGEQLSDAQRAVLRRAFACPVRNNYGASEFFSIAWECGHGRLHLNDDWVILEPVDRESRPVPSGSAAHAVLLTHLANHVQPLLRYRLDDAVRFTGERCRCGSAFPVIEVQGRSAHTLLLHGADDRPVTVLPLAVETAIEEGAQVTQFQLLCTAPDALELRFEPEVADPDAAFARARRALLVYLGTQGLDSIRVTHGRGAPLRDRLSGKVCRVRHAPPALS